MDKLNLAALEATLRLYRDERSALASIPTLRMLTMTQDQLMRRADMIVRKLRRSVPRCLTLVKHMGESSAGGGSFPLLQLPTTLIEVSISGASPHRIEETLRLATVPVIGRIHRDRFLLDARTLLDCDLQDLSASLTEATEKCRESQS
jgi:L-seryl-tRNA(Ser) seleniumtransferase